MTGPSSPARQSAIDAAGFTSVWWQSTGGDFYVPQEVAERISDRMLDSLVGPMFIAPDHRGIPTVWVDAPELVAPVMMTRATMTGARVWSLLEAILPSHPSLADAPRISEGNDYGSGDPEVADDIAGAVAKHWEGE